MKLFSSTAITRLRKDTFRFLQDHNLSGGLGILCLLFVVDYWPVLHYRLVEHCLEKSNRSWFVLRAVLTLFKPFVQGLSGSRLYNDTVIDGGLLLHQSVGVVIGSGTEIGENCTLYAGACMAHKGDFRGSGAPRIGSNVRVGVGAKILGNVKVGDGATIGANAVVIDDVPAGSIAVGIPARSMRSNVS